MTTGGFVWEREKIKVLANQYPFSFLFGSSHRHADTPSAVLQQSNEIEAQGAGASSDWRFRTCEEHCAGYWALGSKWQMHPSSFVCGIGTVALKTTWLRCQHFSCGLCQYRVLERAAWLEEGQQTCFSCLPPFLKVSLQQWFFTSRGVLFSARDFGFWLFPISHCPQLGTAFSLGVWV